MHFLFLNLLLVIIFQGRFDISNNIILNKIISDILYCNKQLKTVLITSFYVFSSFIYLSLTQCHES